jgi:nucleoid DNA-binding protein
MSEDWRVEDQAEKLAESPTEIITQYLSEHGAINRKDLIELLMEKCGLSRDEAERFVEDNIEKGKLRYNKRKRGYVWSFGKSEISRIPRMPRLPNPRMPPRRRAKARIDSVLKLPPDPHTLPSKSHFLAKDWHPYYHPAMDKDKLAYLRAKEKMGKGADWPA